MTLRLVDRLPNCLVISVAQDLGGGARVAKKGEETQTPVTLFSYSGVVDDGERKVILNGCLVAVC